MQAMDVVLDLVRRAVIEVRLDGTIWRLRNLNTTPLPAPRRMETRSSNGYLIVKVEVARKQHAVTAHRLVWTSMHGPIPDGLEPNHRDGNKANNAPENLELVTRSENIKHAWATGLRVRSNRAAEIRKEALALRAQGLSLAKVGENLGVSETTVFRAMRLTSALS